MNRFREMDLEPKTAEEVNECAEPRGMRRRIQLYARHDTLTRAVLDMASHHGLSGEDTMTMLAFHALKRLEKLTDERVEYAMTHVEPHVIPTVRPDAASRSLPEEKS